MSHKSFFYKDIVLSDVYGKKIGWRMFDRDILTSDVEDFLCKEALHFKKYIEDYDIRTVVEVGAGYGRYGDVVQDAGATYIGIDLIDWLVEIGEWYHKKNLGRNFKIQRTSVLDVDQIISKHSVCENESTVIFFPFNCLGNISYIEHVLQKLSSFNTTVVCSVFNNDEETDEVRNAYYKRCGLSELATVRNSAQGSYITSREGFDSVGYTNTMIKTIFESHGYDMFSCEDFSEYGSLFSFRGSISNTNERMVVCGKSSAGKEVRRLGSSSRSMSYKEFSQLTSDHTIKSIYCIDLNNEKNKEDRNKKYTGLLCFDTIEIERQQDILSLLETKIESDGVCPIFVVETHVNDESFFYPVRI